MKFYLLYLQIDQGKRDVSVLEGKMWSQGKGFYHFETSAATGEGINEMFQVDR